MKLTNIYNLPDGIAQALTKEDFEPNLKRMSVTDLIGPPLIRTLKLTKSNEITNDVSEYLWALLGNAIHYILSKTSGETEVKLEYSYQDLTIVGKIDRIDDDFIEDYKITSVWSFLNGVKDEWSQQLNVYDWLRQKVKNKRAKGLRINAILRDWTASKTVDPDYPRIPFYTIEVPQWPFEEQERYVNWALTQHQEHPERECSSSDKWQKEAKFAVMKTKNKRALRVLDSLAEAENWCLSNNLAQINSAKFQLSAGVSIVERPGECTRCKLYCPVRSVCRYANNE